MRDWTWLGRVAGLALAGGALLAGVEPEPLLLVPQPPTPPIDSGDAGFVMMCTALVLMMSLPGLALLYGGLLRSKNVLSIFMQIFAVVCLVSVLWVLYGYSLCFDTTGMVKGEFSFNSLIGSPAKAFLRGVVPEGLNGTIPETVFIAFQLTFAVITPALVLGAFAERVTFAAVLWFTALWFTLVYCPICHMAWAGNGSLFGDLFGAIDYAGGTVIEVNSGIAGLVAALVVGRRAGYPHEPMKPHSMVLCLIGASLLWVGWFGFNAGSALKANSEAGMSLLITHLTTAVAALVWMFLEWIRHGKPSALGIVTGAIAGLVAVTPACGHVGVPGAFAIGAAASGACFLAVTVLKQRFAYDDTLDVFGVHGVGGIVGTLLTGVFASTTLGGVREVEILPQLLAQAKAVGVTALWSGGMTALILVVIDRTIGLRVPASYEATGLDLTQHGEVAYNS